MHYNSYKAVERFKAIYLADKEEENITIFDLGSQDVNGTYRPIFANEKWKYIGCDMENGRNVDIVLNDVYDWKEVKSNSMDVVISGQVLEHAEYFWNSFIELVRVLKVEGYGCVVAPAVWPEHKYPKDCWRFFSDGFRALAKFAGVEVLEVYTNWQNSDPSHPNCIDSVLIFKKIKLKDSEKIKQDEKFELVRKLANEYEIKI